MGESQDLKISKKKRTLYLIGICIIIIYKTEHGNIYFFIYNRLT